MITRYSRNNKAYSGQHDQPLFWQARQPGQQDLHIVQVSNITHYSREQDNLVNKDRPLVMSTGPPITRASN